MHVAHVFFVCRKKSLKALRLNSEATSLLVEAVLKLEIRIFDTADEGFGDKSKHYALSK